MVTPEQREVWRHMAAPNPQARRGYRERDRRILALLDALDAAEAEVIANAAGAEGVIERLRTRAEAAEAERDRLREGIEELIASPDDTQWWEVVPYMDPPEQDEVVEVQVIAADRLRALLDDQRDSDAVAGEVTA